MKINFRKVLLLTGTIVLILYLGISYVLPRVILKLSREVSTSTAADYGMRYDKHNVLSEDSLLLYGDFIYPFHRNYNEETSSHSLIVLHPLKENTKSIYPMVKRINELDVNIVSFDSRAHGRSEGHLYTMGVNEAKDVSTIIDYILELHPDHSFGIYGKWNTGNIALKAMESDPRISYGIVEAYSDHPLETVQKINYDDVLIKNKFFQDHVFSKSLSYLDIEIEQYQLDFEKINRPILLLKTVHTDKELSNLQNHLVHSEVYHMTFPWHERVKGKYGYRSISNEVIECLKDFISTQSVIAIEDAKTKFFVPLIDSIEQQASK